MGSTQTLIFLKGSTTVDEQEGVEKDIHIAKVLTVYSLPGKMDIATPGDSGCGVFCPLVKEDGWSWAGQLVSIFIPSKTKYSLGFVIPQSEIFRSLEETTGEQWILSS